MEVLSFLIPISIFLGIIGLAGFIWTLRTNQYDDPEGDARRILSDTSTTTRPRTDHAAGGDPRYSLAWVPSQSGALADDLHPQKAALPSVSGVYFTGVKSVPLWLPSQKG